MRAKKIITWNVNGLRAVHKKSFLNWLTNESADFVCLQEVKVSASQVDEDEALMRPHGYHSHWHFSQKPGYAGVAIYSKSSPVRVQAGLGDAQFDGEGRWLEAEFAFEGTNRTLTLISSYWPNSQREHTRLDFKLAFCEAAMERLETLRRQGKQVLICGDFNIAHREIDLKNPKSNQDNAGFLPEERAWMDEFTQQGWVDTFREFEKGPGHYTWWSYRPGVREKNIGWRLDYFFTNAEFKDHVTSVEHLTKVMGSDHCPVRLTLGG